MKKKVAVAFFLAFLSLPAFAQYRLGDDPGFYAGGALGMSQAAGCARSPSPAQSAPLSSPTCRR